MEREHLTRNDFPRAHGAEGFDVDSVGAHLAAVAAHVAALEARINALEVERDTLRRQLEEARASRPVASDSAPEAPVEASTEPAPETAAPAASSNEDEVAARLMASKLALEGKERETILMKLAAEHDLEDPAALVDDVLAKLA